MKDSKENFCEQFKDQFSRVDTIVERVNAYAVGDRLSNELQRRIANNPDFGLSDQVLMNRFAELIAYSNAARSIQVNELIRRGTLARVFLDFDVVAVSSLDTQLVLAREWQNLKDIRFKYKVDRTIRCAQVLVQIENKYGSFMRFLEKGAIPARIETVSDLLNFWEGFDRTRSELASFQMPYFSNFTSFCHLLLDLGFDCIKPDSAVMKASNALGVVIPHRKNSYSESQLKDVVKFVQSYALCRHKRASMIDLYFLIHGGQTDAKPYVQLAYYQ